MSMERTTFEQGECVVLTADLCHRTVGIPGESFTGHKSCKGIVGSAELGVPGDDRPVFCICWCHQKMGSA